MLRTNARAFAAVGTSSDNVERADNVEHFFLKGVCSRFVFHTGVRIVKHALFAGACRTNVPTGIAADTA